MQGRHKKKRKTGSVGLAETQVVFFFFWPYSIFFTGVQILMVLTFVWLVSDTGTAETVTQIFKLLIPAALDLV